MTVHPRGCGERGIGVDDVLTLNGSSPRVRGTQQGGCVPLRVCRFIPAGAGNARERCTGVFRRPVHPRGCGERATIPAERAQAIGSSPRVRGTRTNVPYGRAWERFIPAGAGNAKLRVVERPNGAVHPRGCGERRYQGAALLRGVRFIPAGAGNALGATDCI